MNKKKTCYICTCTHRALYLYTFYVFYFISYQFINFCCWARECLVYARCTKQLKIHLLQTFLYTTSTSPKYISLCHNVSQKVVILPFIICGKCTSSLCMFAQISSWMMIKPYMASNYKCATGSFYFMYHTYLWIYVHNLKLF